MLGWVEGRCSGWVGAGWLCCSGGLGVSWFGGDGSRVVTSPRSRRSKAGRSSLGKSTCRVRKIGFRCGELFRGVWVWVGGSWSLVWVCGELAVFIELMREVSIALEVGKLSVVELSVCWSMMAEEVNVGTHVGLLFSEGSWWSKVGAARNEMENGIGYLACHGSHKEPTPFCVARRAMEADSHELRYVRPFR